MANIIRNNIIEGGRHGIYSTAEEHEIDGNVIKGFSEDAIHIQTAETKSQSNETRDNSKNRQATQTWTASKAWLRYLIEVSKPLVTKEIIDHLPK